MIEINSREEFDFNILHNQEKVIMLLFSSSWCSPCKKLKGKLNSEETIQTLPKLLVLYIDTDTENDDLQEMIEKYKITTIPTQIFVKLIDNKLKKLEVINGNDWIKLVMTYNDLVKNIEN